MQILAIETSLRQASVGLLKLSPDSRSLQEIEIQLDPDRKTTAELVPTIQRMYQSAGLDIRQNDLITTCSGPGSFTGLRIGITVAKTLAHVIGCQVCGINTLELIADCWLKANPEQAETRELISVMDAQRNEVFAQTFRVVQQEVQPSSKISIIARKELEHSQVPVIVGGDERLFGKLIELSNAFFTRIDPLRLAELSSSRREDWTSPAHLLPNYHRKSAAEEKAENSN